MTFDARSKERLEALGRTLPKKLPLPETPPAKRPTASPADRAGAGSREMGATAPDRELPQRLPPGGRRPSAAEPRHALERAQDPADLFRALISASADGTVPPHLLDRLRELEAPRRPDPTGAMESGGALGPGAARGASAPPTSNRRTAPNPSGAAPLRAPGQGGKGAAAPGRRRGSRSPGQASEDQDLYTAFAQLLLEDDAD
jgi:hypothetical protein